MSNYSDSTFTRDENSSWFKIYNLIEPGSTILDVGCSSGNFGEIIIREKQCIVDGIEIDDEDFKTAKTKLRTVWQLNIETDDLSEITGKYDYVYFGDVIEHLVSPANSLKRVSHLLKKNGRVLFSIPNMAHVSVRMMLLSGKYDSGETGLLDKTHIHFYTYNELQRVVNEAGFEFDEINPVKKDFPREIIDDQLRALGLENSKAFMDFLRSSDASIYQYVGSLKYVGERPKVQKLAISSPVDIFQIYLKQTVATHKAQIKSLKREVSALKKVNTELSQEYAKSLEVVSSLQKRINTPLSPKYLKHIIKTAGKRLDKK